MDCFYQIKFLLRVTSNFERENGIDHFSECFKKICDKNPEKILKINNNLEKAGLFFDGNIIFIDNDELWYEVSINVLNNIYNQQIVYSNLCMSISTKRHPEKTHFILQFKSAK